MFSFICIGVGGGHGTRKGIKWVPAPWRSTSLPLLCCLSMRNRRTHGTWKLRLGLQRKERSQPEGAKSKGQGRRYRRTKSKWQIATQRDHCFACQRESINFGRVLSRDWIQNACEAAFWNVVWEMTCGDQTVSNQRQHPGGLPRSLPQLPWVSRSVEAWANLPALPDSFGCKFFCVLRSSVLQWHSLKTDLPKQLLHTGL